MFKPIFQQSALYSNKRRIYQQREAQSCDDLLSSASNLRQTGQKPNVLISGGTGKSEYALNEASFYARSGHYFSFTRGSHRPPFFLVMFY